MAIEKKAKETAPAPSDKQKALETAISQIEKQFGKGAVMRLGQNATMNVEAIPTGSLSLDMALGIGGLPRGRIVEIYGPESSGKTTVALHVVAEAQKRGGSAVFIDVEHALDPVYAKNLGVDIDQLLVSQPDTGEQALEICEALVRSGAVDVVVVDSVAAMVTKAEIEGEMGDTHVGLQARLMSQALRKLTGAIGKSNAIVIFINQLREKIGVMYGNPETTPAAAPSSSTPPSGWMSDAPSSSKPAARSSATGCASRWSKTRSPRPSRRPSLISCTARAFPAWARSWIWAASWISCRNPARGLITAR